MMLRLSRLVACLVVLAGAAPARAQDPADLIVRLSRLEAQLRQMAGQIEELQFKNRQLEERVRLLQEDAEARLAGTPGPRPPRPAVPPALPAPQVAPAPPVGAPTVAVLPPPQAPGRPPAPRADVFDPDADPTAPGAPRPLGTTPPSAPVAAPRPVPGPPLALPGSTPPVQPGGPVGTPRPPAAPPTVAIAPTADARHDYDIAFGFIQRGEYANAEQALRQFVVSHPKSALVPDATYWLGESFLRRSQPREAAEQFLKVSTDYGQSRQAANAMLKLAMSLSALGARDQACSTLREIDRKYPNASAAVKRDTQREVQRVKCAP